MSIRRDSRCAEWVSQRCQTLDSDRDAVSLLITGLRHFPFLFPFTHDMSSRSESSSFVFITRVRYKRSGEKSAVKSAGQTPTGPRSRYDAARAVNLCSLCHTRLQAPGSLLREEHVRPSLSVLTDSAWLLPDESRSVSLTRVSTSRRLVAPIYSFTIGNYIPFVTLIVRLFN